MLTNGNGYPLVQIYRAKVKMLLCSVWRNRVLSIHYEKFLEEVIVCAKQHTEIVEKDLRIIKRCRKSLLYHEDEAWKKKESESCFDVTMGSNDGAEICELTGIYILSQLSKLLPQEDIGLNRDGLYI